MVGRGADMDKEGRSVVGGCDCCVCDCPGLDIRF